MFAKKLRVFILILLDMLFVNIAYILALLLRFEFSASAPGFDTYFQVVLSNCLWFMLIRLVVYAIMGLYKSLWRYASMDELVKIVVACSVSTLLSIAYLSMTNQALPRSVHCIELMLSIILVGGSRFAYRYFRNLRTPGTFTLRRSQDGKALVPGVDIDKRILLVGCGDAGASMIKEVAAHKEYKQKIVVAVDDDPYKQGKRISGVKIAGDRNAVPKLCEKYNVDEIIIAIPSASRKTISELIEICHNTKCKVKVMPSMIDLINEKVSVKSLRDVEIEDLLGRDPVQVDLREITGYLEDKIVLVTGAGGSIGSELCRQIAKYHPRRLILFDIYENSEFDIQNELIKNYPGLDIEAAIGSVRDRGRMEELFSKYKPHVIFHAAAHKHVPLMEGNPKEAILNNVLGTSNVIDMAEKYMAEHFILISTDKAVNPTNVMGASKRMCEMLMQNKAEHCKTTTFAAVRFGNVLGSNGSVIPTFRKQIAAGGPVTVTHRDITRYFMTIPEAVQLVIQAGAMANGGEIFILDMGEPVKILNLAEKLIKLSGYTPYEDIDIKVTGLRPGEKLYEELLLAEEGIKETSHNKIFVGHPISITEAFSEIINTPGELEKVAYGLRTKSDAEVKAWVSDMVPNYVETPNK